MLYFGLAGSTAEELEDILFMGIRDRNRIINMIRQHQEILTMNDQEYEATLQTSNRIYVDQSIQLLGSYIEEQREYKMEETQRVNFHSDAGRDDAAKKINGWIKERTKGLINDMVEPDTLSLIHI